MDDIHNTVSYQQVDEDIHTFIHSLLTCAIEGRVQWILNWRVNDIGLLPYT